MIEHLKRIEEIIRESAIDKEKKTPGLKFNPGLVLIDLRATGPCSINLSNVYRKVYRVYRTQLVDF